MATTRQLPAANNEFAPPKRARAKAAPRKRRDFNDKRALALVMELMAIRGGSGNESDVAAYVVAKLRAAGVPASSIKFDMAHLKTPIKGDVGNLSVQLPGTLKAPRRLFMAHMDTVPI